MSIARFLASATLLATLLQQPLRADAPEPGDLLTLGEVEYTPFKGLTEDYYAELKKDLASRDQDWKDFGPAVVFQQMFQEHVADTVPSRGFTYASVDSHGHPRTYSGRVYLPPHKQGTPPVKVPLVVYQHATETRRNFTPYYKKGDETMLGALAADIGGFVVAMPDGDGMGADPSTEMHAYCHNKTGATCLVDCIRAVMDETENGDEVFDNVNYVWDGRTFIVGYSEGGYLAMAAVRELTTNPKYKDVVLTGAAAMAGPFNFYASTTTLLKDDKNGYDRPYIPAYFMDAWASVYPQEINFKEAVNPRLLKADANGENIESWLSGRLGGDQISPKMQQVLAGDPKKEVPAASILETGWLKKNVLDPNSRLAGILKQNDLVGGWVPKVPVLLVHDPYDTTVTFDNSKAMYDDWFANAGKPLGIAELAIGKKGTGHVLGAIMAIPMAFIWIDAGMPANVMTMAKDKLKQAIVNSAPTGLEENAQALADSLDDRNENVPQLGLSLVKLDPRVKGDLGGPYKVTFNDYFAVIGKVKFYTLEKTPPADWPKQAPSPLGGYTTLVKEMRKKGDIATLDPGKDYYMAVYPGNGFVGLTLKFAGGPKGKYKEYTINIKQAFKNKVANRSASASFSCNDACKPVANAASYEKPKESVPFLEFP